MSKRTVSIEIGVSRTSDHCTTGGTLAKIMFERELRTRWDDLQNTQTRNILIRANR